jgi:hypothetical protein
MDVSPTQTPIVRLLLELDPTPDGRLEGRIGIQASDSSTPFSGVLELLKVLEDTLTVGKSAAHNPAREGTDS